MRVLALDIGSSSVKAAVLTGSRPPKQIEHEAYRTDYGENRAEIPVERIATALKKAISRLSVKTIDVIVPTGMSPSWIAMDSAGKPLSPVITHQDRRSVEQAKAIETEIGKARHLHLTGNRPVPGGISSTTARWFAEHHPREWKRVDLVGHLNTWLARTWCDARAIDTSNASFTGLYRTTNLGGWDDRLAAVADVPMHALPTVMDGHHVAGRVTRSAARSFGLPEGVPLLAGVIDGSCSMLLGGIEAGCATHVVGSTDVFAVCTERAKPKQGLLTRALGVGRTWLSVGTLAAAGSALNWLHAAMFSDMKPADYWKLTRHIGCGDRTTTVQFDNRLAGSRTQIETDPASIRGLSLDCDREDVLTALLADLRRGSGERLARFADAGVAIDGRNILTTGGGEKTLAPILRRDFPKTWTYRFQNEATLRGAWVLATLAAEH